MSKGLTFWRKDEDGQSLHLRFVLSEPDVDGKVLIVHMTTYHDNGREDQSCILDHGDHICVKVKSFIRYDRAFERDLMSMLIEKTNGSISIEPDLTPAILKRIQEGAMVSPALPKKFKKYFDYF